MSLAVQVGVSAVAEGRDLALSPCARFIAVREANALRVLHATSSKGPIDVPGAVHDFVWIGHRLWVASDRELRVIESDGRSTTSLAFSARSLLNASAVDGVVANGQLISIADESLKTESLGAIMDESIIAFLGGLRTLRARDSSLRITDPDKEVARFRLIHEGQILSASQILDGRVIAVVSQVGNDQCVDVLKLTGGRINQIQIRNARDVAIAPVRGIALATTHDDEVLAFDLRFGKLIERGPLPIADCRLDIDDRAEHVAIARHRSGHRTSVYRVHFRELFAQPMLQIAAAREPLPPPVVVCPPEQDALTAPKPRPIPTGALTALAYPSAQLPLTRLAPGVKPYSDPIEHLDELVELGSAQAALAIVLGATEVGLPSETSSDAERWSNQIASLNQTISDRVTATIALGKNLPLRDIPGQFGLDSIELDVIAVVAASAISAKAARLYATLADDADRTFCDRALIVEVLGQQVRRALRRGGRLFRFGLLKETGSSSELFAHIVVAEPLLDRLRASLENQPGAVTTLVRAQRALDELSTPRDVLINRVEHLQLPSNQPARVVVRGRVGLGGTQLLASLTAHAGSTLALIEVERLPDGVGFVTGLYSELVRARLWGAVPCVSGLADRDRESDGRWRAHLREVFRTFEGPILLRAGTAFEVPLDPGYFEVTIPNLSESERREHWRRALKGNGFEPGSADALARRTRLGASAIDAVVAQTSLRGAQEDTERLTAVARQQIDARIGTIATRIDRLGTWDQLALDRVTLDAVREIVARSRHRRTVFDQWGFDEKVTSSRGLTALFSGPPGTGKTLVAGVIARELGLDLYRVDLARLVSKWIGETEKNLARLFDAAEDSQAVILFDEADALFSRRTDVKSSNDRHANMETGYLLQRLDSFEGIAILTTNLSKSIDKAVSRRLSMRIEFPLPDAATRIALWRAHLPEGLPTTGDLDLERLARDYPMTGGFIRNCALRAAFLAAADGVALTCDHLERAIDLEYTQAGRISKSGQLK